MARAENPAGHSAALFGTEAVSRAVGTPEPRGITFHEVRARSIVNRVPGTSRMPFERTVNPYRDCGHACVYCFTRKTHTYLDLDTGPGFDSQIVVKANAPELPRATVRAVAAAGAASEAPLVLHLRPGAREWFIAWPARHHPYPVRRYERMYADGAYAPK